MRPLDTKRLWLLNGVLLSVAMVSLARVPGIGREFSMNVHRLGARTWARGDTEREVGASAIWIRPRDPGSGGGSVIVADLLDPRTFESARVELSRGGAVGLLLLPSPAWSLSRAAAATLECSGSPMVRYRVFEAGQWARSNSVAMMASALGFANASELKACVSNARALAFQERSERAMRALGFPPTGAVIRLRSGR